MPRHRATITALLFALLPPATALAQPAHPQTGIYDAPFAATRAQTRPPIATLPIPAGYTRAQIELGDRIFHGEAADGTCAACHGIDARGTGVGNDLSVGMFLWSDGSVKQLARTIHHNMKTVLGQDGKLTDGDVVAVSVYIWALDHEPLNQRVALARATKISGQ